MFNNFIQQTPFSSDIADEVMSSVSGRSPIRGDVSFVSTLRALVFKRASAAGEELCLAPRSASYSKHELDEVGADNAYQWVIPNSVEDRGIIHILNFNNYSEDANELWFSAITETFPKKYSGWTCLEKVGYYFRKRFPLSCFINPELHSVYLFTRCLNASNAHHIQCAIPAFLPWFFGTENPITALDKLFFQSRNESNSAHYEEVLEKIAAEYDFRAEKIRRVLSGFETKYERAILEGKYNSLRDIERALNDYQRRISDYLAEKTKLDLDILGIENKIANTGDGSEMMDYFLANPFLSIGESDGASITFVVKTELAYWKTR